MSETAIRYKPRALLEPSERLLGQMHQLGQLDPDQHELASSLGCSVDTLQRFWRAHPQYKEAFEDGQAKGRLLLRRVLRGHSMVDPPTARFLAKQYLKMSDDPSKAQADQAAAGLMRNAMTREEVNGRLLELKAKLIGETVGRSPGLDQPGVAPRASVALRPRLAPPRDARGGASVGPAHARDQARPGRGDLDGIKRTGTGAPVGSDADGQVSAVSRNRPRVQPVGPMAPVQEDAPGAGLEALARRVHELEASSVRKNPRKDGAPHTDRTQQQEVAQPANRVQMGINGGPPLLPGHAQRRGKK